MRDCVLTMYGEQGFVLGERRVVVPPLPERPVLDRMYREHIDPGRCRYAVAREERKVRALYLADDLLPDGSVKLPGRRRQLGRWATTSMELAPGHKVFAGPDVFFRQMDLPPASAWLATVLVGFGCDVEVRELVFGAAKDTIYEWEVRDERFYYRVRRSRWALFGAGNTPPQLVERLIESRPASSDDFLWTAGAIRLVTPKK